MARGETTDEFAARMGARWPYFGGLPGDPGWVSDAARTYGDQHAVDAESLDELAADDGWEPHDSGYEEKIKDLAERQSGVRNHDHVSGSETSAPCLTP